MKKPIKTALVSMMVGVGLWVGAGVFSYGMSRHCFRRSVQYAVMQDESRITAKDMKHSVDTYADMIKGYEEMAKDFSKMPRAAHLYEKAVKDLKRARELYVMRKEQYSNYKARLDKIDEKLEGYEKGYERWKGLTKAINPFD